MAVKRWADEDAASGAERGRATLRTVLDRLVLGSGPTVAADGGRSGLSSPTVGLVLARMEALGHEPGQARLGARGLALGLSLSLLAGGPIVLLVLHAWRLFTM